MHVKLGIPADDVSRANERLLAGALTRLGASSGVEFEVETVHVVEDPLADQRGAAAVLLRALAEGELDLALTPGCSASAQPDESITLVAAPRREDSREALCGAGKHLAELDQAAIVLVPDALRAAALRAAAVSLQRQDLTVVVERKQARAAVAGVGTDYSAAIVDVAALKRLGLVDAMSELLDRAAFLPPAGQAGAEIYARSDADKELINTVARLDHAPTRVALAAERIVDDAVRAATGVPLAVHATVDADGILIEARAIAPSGALQLNERLRLPVSDADRAARAVAHALLGRSVAALERA